VPLSQAVARLVHVFPQDPPTLSFLPPSLSPSLSPSTLSALADSFEICFSDTPGFFKAKGKELLHHFITTTSATLATHNPTQQIWQVSIPKIATTHPYLIHGIVAATSLHLSGLHNEPDAKRAYINIALDQINASLSHYRKDVANITAENCEALFAFSTLTVVFIFRTARDDSAALLSLAKQHQNVDRFWMAAQLTTISLKILNGVRGGAKVILTPSWFWITQGPLAQLCERKWWPKDRALTSPRSIEDDRRLHQLEKLWMVPGRPYEPTHDHMGVALRNLRDCFALVAQLTTGSTLTTNGAAQFNNARLSATTGTLMDRGAVFTWPVSLTQEFLTLLEQQHPQAFALFAHWAILFHRISDLWFVDGLAHSIVVAAASILGKDRLSWIEWPIREIGLDLPYWIGGPRTPNAEESPAVTISPSP
jgi:hypothetical protein